MELSADDIKQIEAENAELSAVLAAKENGEKVVLLISGPQCGEVVRKTELTVTLVFYNRYSEILTTELEKQGFKPAVGYRVIKANGTLLYLVPTPDGPDVYTIGKYYPAMRKKK